MKLIECPRDAMQGVHHFIDTKLKVEYLNLLLQVGFDTLDFGSFVSSKAIPQLRDTGAVLSALNLSKTKTKLLAIVANLRGVDEAVTHKEIQYLGFPFSISETFQRRNTNSSIADSLLLIEQLLERCHDSGKEAVVYLSMGFGNPYGDDWTEDIVERWSDELINRGVKILSLADTIGVSTPEKIKMIIPPLIAKFPDVEIGVHLHSTPDTRFEKIKAAYDAGCKRFDSALKGFGGCPMASNDLTGNLATEDVITFLTARQVNLNLDMKSWSAAMELSKQVF